MPDRKDLIKEGISLSREGYQLSDSYSKASIQPHLREEGIEQKKFYIKKLTELLAALCREN